MHFILNEKEINTSLPSGTLLLDFIRYHQHLTGTKIGCREGDCGACTVLVGEINNDELQYRSVTSCLTAIGNIAGKHVVTIEGINIPAALNPVQQAMCDTSATQCGFCTPGFVMSLTGFCLSNKQPSYENAVKAMDGNICRCTGYKSIERAAEKITALMQQKKEQTTIDFITQQQILPTYFNNIKERLYAINGRNERSTSNAVQAEKKFLGGGTDLYVQQHDTMHETNIHFLFNNKVLKGITQQENICVLGAAVTVSDMMESDIIQAHFPAFLQYAKLVSSTPIRNIATIAGNFVNASPIGDLTIFFLALNAQLVLSDGITKRELPLRNLYKGYKTLNKNPEEYIEKIWFELPDNHTRFHFEKVSKRTHLDIASVNTAICIRLDINNKILHASLSAGGIAPVPSLLSKTSAFLTGKVIDETLIEEIMEVLQTEVSPISDARGSAAYKTLLLQQLVKAHFIHLFPMLEIEKVLQSY